jgi:hypothetical protein
MSGGGLRTTGAGGRTGGGTYARGFLCGQHADVESVAASHNAVPATTRTGKRPSRIRNRRELDLKRGSLALLAGKRDSTIVQLNGPVRHGQTDP